MFDRDSKDSCENPKCFFDVLKRNEKEMNQNKRIILLVDSPLYNVKNKNRSRQNVSHLVSMFGKDSKNSRENTKCFLHLNAPYVVL